MPEDPKRELHRIAPTAIIHKGGKFLILQRAPHKKMFPRRWTVPGGGLSMDDYINTPKSTPDAWYYSIENCLKREIKEESGLEVDKLKYLVDLTFVRSDNIPVVTLSYYCGWKSGDVKLDEDSTDYRWVSAKEAENYDLIEGILEEIKMVDDILKGKNPDEVEFKTS